jgi:hypothetical protein
MYVGLHVNYPLFLSYFNETYRFLGRYSKSIQIQNFIKIRPAGAELFQAHERKDGQTDRHAVTNNRFSQFHENAYNIFLWRVAESIMASRCCLSGVRNDCSEMFVILQEHSSDILTNIICLDIVLFPNK